MEEILSKVGFRFGPFKVINEALISPSLGNVLIPDANGMMSLAPTAPHGEWMSATEVAKIAGVCADTVRTWGKKNKIRNRKENGQYRFEKNSVEGFLATYKNKPSRRKLMRSNMTNLMDASTGDGSKFGPLTEEGLALLLGVTTDTIVEWRLDGKLPFKTVDGMNMFSMDDILNVFTGAGIDGVSLVTSDWAWKTLGLTISKFQRIVRNELVPYVVDGRMTQWFGRNVIMKIYSRMVIETNPKTSRKRVSLGRKIHEVITEPLFTVGETAEMLGVSADDVLKAQSEGKIDYIIASDKSIRYPWSEILHLKKSYGEPRFWRIRGDHPGTVDELVKSLESLKG